MSKNKWLSTTLALSIGLGGTFTYATYAGAEQAASTEVQAAATITSATTGVNAQAIFQVTADVTAQQKLIADFTEIKELFSASTPDLAKVKAFYQKQFQPAIQARSTQIDEEISFLLDAGIQGKTSVGQVKQAIDKGLQWFFYDEINHIVRMEAGAALEAGDKTKAKEELDKAIALFEGTLYVTAGKRDQDYGTLTQDFFAKVVVPGLQNAVKQGNVTDFHVYRQYLQKTMMKVYVLATAKYAGKVQADHAEGKTEDEKAHLAEGYFFFMPIHNYFAGGSKEAADYVKNAFASGDGAKMNAEEVEKMLARAIIAKVNEYASAAINKDLASGDLDKAKIHAAEGNAFLSQIEIIVKERLGADAWTSLEAEATQYNQAITANNLEKARTHAFQILKTLSTISGVSFGIGGNTIQIQGETSTSTEATSYLDTKTNRTMASARFVSEALGAVVTPNQQKITVQKGEKTVEFTIGSQEVYINGKKAETTLDQAAVIKSGRTYIPLRAAAELLDSKVFYYNGEVIMNY